MNQAIDLLLTPNLTMSVSGRRSASPAYTQHCADQVGMWIDRIRPDVVMSGMALGIDMICASAAVERGRRLYAVVPGEWQPDRWHEDRRLEYRSLLSRASRLTVIDKTPLTGTPGSQRTQVIKAFNLRNQFMAAKSDLTMICWDGITSGGTYNMLAHCANIAQPVLLIQPGENTRLLCDQAALRRALARRAGTDVPVPAPEIVAVA